ncbi:MAG: PepSY domain-containing protein [Pseudomonadota bacterium]
MSRRKPRRIHRRIAGVAIALVLWFALTGLLLNHAHDLGFDRQPLPGNWTQRLYGTHLPDELSGVHLGEYWVVALGETLYAGTDAISACPGGLRGARLLGDYRVVACADAVHLLDADGNRVERIGAAWGIDGDILGLAGTDHLLIATSTAGYCADTGITELKPCTRPDVLPVPALTPLPAENRAALAGALSPPSIDIERLVHDLHSGRLFGPLARWVWDLFALSLLVLAASGWLLLRRRPH